MDELSRAISNTNLPFDVWMAPNHLAILSTYVHWFSSSGKRIIKPLAFRRVVGKHAGENQAQIVLGVLEELEIRVQIGCLVGDDAAPNDTAVSAI